MLEPTRFEGTLSGHGVCVPVGFTAAIDDLGELQLELDRLPFSREAYPRVERQIFDETLPIAEAVEAPKGHRIA